MSLAEVGGSVTMRDDIQVPEVAFGWALMSLS